MELAGWMEKPCPLAVNLAVIPPAVRLIGSGEKPGAFSKSNRTSWASECVASIVSPVAISWVSVFIVFAFNEIQ